MTASSQIRLSLQTVASKIAAGFFAITHNSFALIGLLMVCGAIVVTTRPDLRQAGEEKLMDWLQERQFALLGTTGATKVDAIDRATASDPKVLPKQQAAVAYWLSKKYRVAPEPISALVTEAYEIGTQTQLDPTLILAIMAIESGFNPFAQSSMGAQGLMQVMTQVHTDKYQTFGGHFAAFDPVTNLRVGVKVLQECIARAGSIEGGLRYYVGAAKLSNDGGYASKVLAEHARLRQVASGRSVPMQAPTMQAARPTPPTTTAPAQTIPVRAPPATPVATTDDKVAVLTSQISICTTAKSC